jgi:hypothetical protein
LAAIGFAPKQPADAAGIDMRCIRHFLLPRFYLGAG